MAWLSERRKDVKLFRIEDRLRKHQGAFTKVGEAMFKATYAPKGLQDTMVFPHKSLRKLKLKLFNVKTGQMNLNRVGGKVFQTCLSGGCI